MGVSTPRPWHIGSKKKYAIFGTSSEYAVATVPHVEGSGPGVPLDPSGEADVALIVDAVNAHDRLVRIEDAARWYLRCRDLVGEGKVARGLDEAEDGLRHALEVESDA